MTLSERLEALAKDHEDKARGLRLALTELNGHVTTQAKGAMVDRLKGALKLRGKVGRPPGNGRDKGHRAKEPGAYKAATIAVLSDKPMSVEDYAGAMKKRGWAGAVALGPMIRFGVIKRTAKGLVLGKNVTKA